MDHERQLLQMACRSSTTTFRRDTATEKVPGPRELLSKGYAFLKNPISMATHAQFHLPGAAILYCYHARSAPARARKSI
jgi:hypothetical protein